MGGTIRPIEDFKNKKPKFGTGFDVKKNIISDPMNYNQIRDAVSQYNEMDSSHLLSQMDDQSHSAAFQPDISGIEINETESRITALDDKQRKRMRLERIKKRAAKTMTN